MDAAQVAAGSRTILLLASGEAHRVPHFQIVVTIEDQEDPIEEIFLRETLAGGQIGAGVYKALDPQTSSTPRPLHTQTVNQAGKTAVITNDRQRFMVKSVLGMTEIDLSDQIIARRTRAELLVVMRIDGELRVDLPQGIQAGVALKLEKDVLETGVARQDVLAQSPGIESIEDGKALVECQLVKEIPDPVQDQGVEIGQGREIDREVKVIKADIDLGLKAFKINFFLKRKIL